MDVEPLQTETGGGDDDVLIAENDILFGLSEESAEKQGYLNCSDKDWDLFNGIRATENWTFKGFMMFVAFGPTSNYMSILLKMGGDKDKPPEEKQAGGREAMRKKQKTREALEQSTGGFSRGMSMDTKVNIAAVAQAEDEANMRMQDRDFAVLTQQLSAVRSMAEMNIQMANMTDGAAKQGYLTLPRRPARKSRRSPLSWRR